MQADIIIGGQFQHVVFFARRGHAQARLYVFIDGDGSPWRQGGEVVADDPSPRRPLALELAAATPRPVLYVGRPCALGVPRTPACAPAVWTSARYSGAVVDSIASVINRYVAANAFEEVVIIGYSGGGVLAVLCAPHVPTSRGVVTIAANLDVAAWTSAHGYLPLEGSLDPAQLPALDSALPRIHLTGGHDDNVPAALNRRYFERSPAEQLWAYPAFDHVCCWVDQWPQLFLRIEQVLPPPGLRERATAP